MNKIKFSVEEKNAIAIKAIKTPEGRKAFAKMIVNRIKYKRQLEFAFGGTGGGIVKEYYKEYEDKDETLDNAIKEIENWSEECPEECEGFEFSNEIYDKEDEEKVSFILSSLPEDRCHMPEMCGSIAGILFSHGFLEESLQILQVEDADDYRYWDS